MSLHEQPTPAARERREQQRALGKSHNVGMVDCVQRLRAVISLFDPTPMTLMPMPSKMDAKGNDHRKFYDSFAQAADDRGFIEFMVWNPKYHMIGAAPPDGRIYLGVVEGSSQVATTRKVIGTIDKIKSRIGAPDDNFGVCRVLVMISNGITDAVREAFLPVTTAAAGKVLLASPDDLSVEFLQRIHALAAEGNGDARTVEGFNDVAS